MPGEMPDEASVEVQGFRPLPKTCVSPELHGSRPEKHQCGTKSILYPKSTAKDRWVIGTSRVFTNVPP
ncbi:hypothetical protein HAX54_037650, partial [Datura stramonium]|nr:hypothetical protein [Datura stramonium]